MAHMRWSKFFWSDWESDEGLRQCSLAAQGLWMRLLCICAKGDPYGYLSVAGLALDVDGMSRATGISETELAPLLAELDRWGVFSRDRHGRIYSRRMTKDARKADMGRKHAAKRWAHDVENKQKNPLPNGLPIGVPTTQKLEARSQIEERESDRSSESQEPRIESCGDGPASNVVPLASALPRATGYVFEGRIVRLTKADYDRWRTAYSAIPDLRAELTGIDDYLADEGSGDGKKWFHRVSGMLGRKHREMLAQAKPEITPFGSPGFA